MAYEGRLNAAFIIAAFRSRELNISSPNVRQGGACPAQDAGHTARLVGRVKERIRKPLIVKLSPNVVDIVGVALAAQVLDCEATT